MNESNAADISSIETVQTTIPTPSYVHMESPIVRSDPPPSIRESAPDVKVALPGNVQEQTNGTALSPTDGGICCLWEILIPIVIVGVTFSMLFFGAFYITQCPAEKKIPIFNLVASAVILVYCEVYRRLINTKRKRCKICLEKFSTIVELFLTAWFIAGGVWVYSIKPDYYHENSSNYCNKALYLFTLWLLNIVFILAIVALFTCFVSLIRDIREKNEEREFLISS